MTRRESPPAIHLRLLVAILAIVAACSPGAALPAPQPSVAVPLPRAEDSAGRPQPFDVVVGVPGLNLTHLPYYVGLKAGIFDAEGVRLTLTQLATSVTIPAMIDGQVGYGTSAASIIRAAANGLAVRLIAGGRDTPDWQLLVQPAIRSIADLRGKRIGTTAPTSADTLIVYEILAREGIGKQDVEAINLQSVAGVYRGLMAGQIDGGL